MPTYEYRCRSCGHNFEIVQSFSDEALTECPSCDGPLRKVFGNIGITFKGSGFYKTDHGSRASSAGGDGDGTGKKAGKEAGDAKGSGDGGSGSGDASSGSGDAPSGSPGAEKATASASA